MRPKGCVSHNARCASGFLHGTMKTCSTSSSLARGRGFGADP
jgi:hypothetical protein